MAQYRKRPIIVDAVQFFPTPAIIKSNDDGTEYLAKPEVLLRGIIKVPAMTVNAKERRGITYDAPAHYVVLRPDGHIPINPGDWLITGAKGEQYPCRADIFELSYEKVSADTNAVVSWWRRKWRVFAVTAMIVIPHGLLAWAVMP